MKRLLTLVGLGGLLAAGIITAAPAEAGPIMRCNSAPFVGTWCDSDWWADGSYLHQYSGWGTYDMRRVCPMEGNPVNPPETDYDPRTPCGFVA